jgi:ribosomal protein S18 acetylase RimI-like enzyme
MLTTLTGTRNSILKLEVESKDFIQRDAFLESILNRPAYKINKLTDPVDLKFLQDKTYKKKSSFLYTKVDCSDVSTLRFFENSGFKIIEENITLEKKGGEAHLLKSFEHRQQYEIRWAQNEDRKFIEKIAQSSFSHDRFHQDPNIDNSLADEIKRQWAGNFFSGKRGDAMIVSTANNRPVAFLLLLLAKKQSVIDLIAVSKEHRKKGLSKQMISYAMRELSDRNRWYVGTQSTNVPSVRLYESLGFQTMGSQYVLHRHSF